MPELTDDPTLNDADGEGEATAPESGDDSEAKFVILHHLNSPIEAEMVNDILRQNGIRSVAQSSGSDALAVLSTSASGAIVLVDERDYDRAEELYAAFFGQDTSPLTGTTVDEDNENDAEAE